ncbi:hypothetical protein ACJMK2_019428 [Sinanodonta woodiana]|uniref:Nucleotide-diphospho-sugar transferase domain-containing protein n=1 Tax=Sinanodonta woodiana TaxID=1069815 RepID=A0ABD3UJF3_SINWO
MVNLVSTFYFQCCSSTKSRCHKKGSFFFFAILSTISFILTCFLLYNTAYRGNVNNTNIYNVPAMTFDMVVDKFRNAKVKSEADILINATSWMKTETPILTLFTSWLHRQDKYVVQNRTVQNWRFFWPHIRPVLFTNDTELGDICRRQGWSILPLTHTAIDGVPVVKYMYLDAMRHFNSTFYGFANADILFNDGLVNTLLTIRKFTDIYRDPVLITGLRTNFNYKIPCNATDMKNISKVSEKGKLANPMSADYFITTRDYPWGKMEEIVIGRNQVDNWIIRFSQLEKIHVINSTPTVTALHQTTETGIFESGSKPNKFYNSILIKEIRKIKINTQQARVGCAEFVTNFMKHGHIQIMRQPLSKQC